jgi:hypothetical protein
MEQLIETLTTGLNGKILLGYKIDEYEFQSFRKFKGINRI